jgi:hypothetical protein
VGAIGFTLLNTATQVALFAQRNKAPARNADADAGGMAGGLACMLCPLAFMGLFVLLAFAIGWKLFSKAGRPGWEAIVPFYNSWVLVTLICKLEPLWFFLQFVPIANIISAWKVSMELAKKFGKSDGFGIGLFLLGPVFAAILAFGDAKYQGGRRRDYDDDDYDDDEEEDRPKKKKSYDDDDEDDRPRNKKKSRDYDDE